MSKAQVNPKLTQLFDFLLAPGIEYNLEDESYWGVLFDRKENGKYSATAVSAIFIIEVSDLDEEPGSDFYSFFENKWLDKTPYPYEKREMFGQLYNNDFDRNTTITVPIANFINFINQLEDAQKKDSRIVFSPSYVGGDDLIVKFKFENGYYIFRHPAENRPFILGDTESIIKAASISLDSYYRTKIAEERSDCIILNAVEPFGKMRAGIIHSQKGFFPESLEITNSLSQLLPHAITAFNHVKTNTPNLPFVHIDCMVLYTIIKTFVYTGSRLINIHIDNENPLSPIFISNVKDNAMQKQMCAKIAPLDPFMGPQRR